MSTLELARPEVEPMTPTFGGTKMIGLALRLWTVSLFVLVMVVASFATARASSHSAFDARETAEIEKIIEEYLQAHPEIVLEAIRKLQQRQRLAEAEQSRRQIALRSQSLHHDPDSPVGGNPEGDVTIVEFFDYRCPYCKAVVPQIAELLEEDAEIRFVYKEWPILGEESVFAARVALAARNQGKYLEIHDRLMTMSSQLDEERVLGAARYLGLDLEKLRVDMEAEEIMDALGRNAELAAALGITGTPAFVIGDVLVPGAVSLSELRDLVEESRSGE